jgi:hypothetical protein
VLRPFAAVPLDQATDPRRRLDPMRRRVELSLRSPASTYARKGHVMSSSTFIEKAEVVATLRSRDLHGRADWVDREFSVLIDTAKNASLLRTLGIDVSTMSAETRDVAPENSHQ